jgi:hypothetical protein
MHSHKIFSPFEYGITKGKTKQIDNIYVHLFPISLNGLVEGSYMGIEIRSCYVNGIG